MIEYQDALRLLLADARLLGVERVQAAAAMGRVLAGDVSAGESLPPFDNSAMDGFALRTAGAVLGAGRELDVEGERAAGDDVVQAGAGAWEIMTGAPVPRGCDAIVPVEQVAVLAHDGAGRAARIRLQVDVPPGQHVRRQGEDVRAGERVLRAGRVAREADVMMMAALGVAGVDVARRPRVALITTGRELVDDAATPLRPGHIRNSNGLFLALRVAAAGSDVVHRETVPDDEAAFRDALRRAHASRADVVVTTGAVSMGRYDFIPATLRELGADVLFHKVRIRPGKPILAARLVDGMRFFGLPGNPASTAVGLRFFVEPVLRALLGLSPENALRLPLAASYAKRVPMRMHLKARVALDPGGQACVHVLGGQESFRIRPLLEANAWAVVPADVDALDAGAMVDVLGRGHLEPLFLEV